jgi:hypothetical protein
MIGAPMRRFLTVRDIEDLAAQGTTELPVDRQTTVTDAARERALERGVRLVPSTNGQPPQSAPPQSAPSQSAPQEDAPALHRRVRQAVLARLDSAPPDLDEVITRVMERHART